MIGSKSSIPKPRSDAWYVCLEPHTSDLGTFHPGDRLLGSHPAVRATPIWWAPEGLSTEELHAERQHRLLLAYPIES